MADSDSMPNIISFTPTFHSTPYPFISPTRPALSAAGKNVLITGGGTGIGHAIASAFALAGAKSVSILGRRSDKLAAGAATISSQSPTTTVLYETADLLNPTQTITAFQTIVSKTGPIDILVANAGGLAPPGPVAGYSADAFTQSITASTLSLFNAFQAFKSHAGPAPVLLHTSSCMANIAPTPGMGAYSVSKAAALKLADFIGAENPDVRVVNVQPGWVATELNGFQKEATDSGESILKRGRGVHGVC